MSKILRRPMFRGGRVSSYGNGIASGLANGGRVNYAGGGQIGGGAIYGKPMGDRYGFQEPTLEPQDRELTEYTDILETVRSNRPKRSKMSTSDYLRLASAGAEILGAPSEGGGIGGLLATAAKPLSKLGTDLATSIDTRNAAEEEAITDIAGSIMKSRNYRPDRGFNIDRTVKLIQENTQKRQELDAALESNEGMVKYIKDNNIIINTTDEKQSAIEIEALRTKIVNEREVIVSVLKDILPKDEYTAAFLKTAQAQLLFSSVIAAEEERQTKSQSDPTFDTNALINAINRIGMKDGGLTTGYATGGLTETEEQIKLKQFVIENGRQPETDAEIDLVYGKGASIDAMMEVKENNSSGNVEMEEEIIDQSSSQSSAPLTYEELRVRLPKEITNDVVKLLSASDEALLEFSNIATQQDVDEFNVKYGVELVLPQV
tara:strand:- start:536 stop:1831 length:1296 start_codon:yes stop_codon:yes gene_type:complete